MDKTGKKIKKYLYMNPKTNETVAGYSDYIDIEHEIGSKCSKRALYVFNMITDYGYGPFGNIDALKLESVARCDDLDNFDERIGRSVATAKLDKKYHLAMAKRYQYLADALEKIKKEFENLQNKHTIKAEHCADSIKKYYKGEDHE